MNFVSPLFLLFLICFLFLRWMVFPILFHFIAFGKDYSSNHNRPLPLKFQSFGIYKQALICLLLLGSYLFYASWNYKFLGLLVFTSFFDFVMGKKIDSAKNSRHRKQFLLLSVILNLLVLGFFKYFYFFTQNAIGLASSLGFSLYSPDWNILLPAGISFYTFQSLSYTIDVYRRVLPSQKSFIQYALFLAFFPQLVAGPIVMAREFLPQIASIYKRKFSDLPLGRAIYLILIGFIKKSVIADNISVISDLVFSNPDQIIALSWSYVLLGMVAYSIQIYGDFSGYTDIARGVAILFGFQLPENFNLPYFASSLTDFWRRWHISLSIWLRSYLYIPLGGNKFGNFFTYRNLLITMLLGGLWHGASWNFLLWGGLHGIYLGFERFTGQILKRKIIFSDVRPFIKVGFELMYGILTFCIVTCLWVFFRSPNFDVSYSIFKAIFSFQKGIELGYSIQIQFYFLFFLVFFAHFIGYVYSEKIEKFLAKEDSSWQFMGYAAIAIFAVLYSGELKPFIYFVF